MLDFAQKWTAPPDWRNAQLVTPELRVSTVQGLSQILLSGNLQAGLRHLGCPGESIGAGGIAVGAVYAIALARDRSLVVSERPIEIADGWHEGFAITAMDDGYVVFKLEGPGLAGILARATTLDAAGTTSSAAISFASIPCIAYRRATPDVLHLHVDRSMAAYAFCWIEHASR